MTDLKTEKALERLAVRAGLDVDGETLLDMAISKLKRDGLLDRTEDGR